MYTLTHCVTKIRNKNLNFIHNAKMLNVSQLISNRTTTPNIIITTTITTPTNTNIITARSYMWSQSFCKCLRSLVHLLGCQINWILLGYFLCLLRKTTPPKKIILWIFQHGKSVTPFWKIHETRQKILWPVEADNVFSYYFFFYKSVFFFKKSLKNTKKIRKNQMT